MTVHDTARLTLHSFTKVTSTFHFGQPALKFNILNNVIEQYNFFTKIFTFDIEKDEVVGGVQQMTITNIGFHANCMIYQPFIALIEKLPELAVDPTNTWLEYFKEGVYRLQLYAPKDDSTIHGVDLGNLDAEIDYDNTGYFTDITVTGYGDKEVKKQIDSLRALTNHEIAWVQLPNTMYIYDDVNKPIYDSDLIDCGFIFLRSSINWPGWLQVEVASEEDEGLLLDDFKFTHIKNDKVNIEYEGDKAIVTFHADVKPTQRLQTLKDLKIYLYNKDEKYIAIFDKGQVVISERKQDDVHTLFKAYRKLGGQNPIKVEAKANKFYVLNASDKTIKELENSFDLVKDSSHRIILRYAKQEQD